MRLREEQKERVRVALLRSGIQLIVRNGIASVTVESITRGAGVAKGTFYNYFDSKEDLVAAAVAESQGGWEGQLRELMAELPTLERRLDEVLRRMCSGIRSHPEIAWIWLMHHLEAGQMPKGQDGDRLIFHHILQQLFANARERDQLRTSRPASHLADDVVGIFLVQVARWYHGPRHHDLYAAVRGGVENYLHGVVSPSDVAAGRDG